jgi:electron transfer flavoprotein alpha subunit
MSILIFAELVDGEVKKSSLQTISYGAYLAKNLELAATVLVVGNATEEVLTKIGNFGVNSVKQIVNNKPDTSVLNAAILQVTKDLNASYIILSKSIRNDRIAAQLSVQLKADLISNITNVPDFSKPDFTVKSSIFSGKAFVLNVSKASNKILILKKNAIVTTQTNDLATVEIINLNESLVSHKIVSKQIEEASGDVLLSDAEIVVSGGRGLKGPENWYLVENLAKALRAATGCSKPVSDMNWRPHHEHVGQTGVKVSPNIYIAVGISGAIQHLAGVNSSKIIVVINKDPEAPFFKAADYGIIGDAFDILPKLTEAAKKTLI